MKQVIEKVRATARRAHKPGKSSNTKKINLALQGGGAHGAYTWGVLDRILEDGRIEIEAISGSSAGAMNAVILADGWTRDGRDGARQALRKFWRGVSPRPAASPRRRRTFSMPS